MGAWIETRYPLWKKSLRKVAPCVSAWIEAFLWELNFDGPERKEHELNAVETMFGNV